MTYGPPLPDHDDDIYTDEDGAAELAGAMANAVEEDFTRQGDHARERGAENWRKYYAVDLGEATYQLIHTFVRETLLPHLKIKTAPRWTDENEAAEQREETPI